MTVRLPLLWHIQGDRGSPLVLLHGWGMHAGLWGAFAGRLADQHRLWMADLPGHGQNRADALWELDELVEQLVHAVDEPAHWMGWSLGGAIAIRAARLFPERVKSVVMCCATPRFREDTGGWPGMSDVLLQRFSGQLQQDYHVCMRRFLALQTWGLEHAGLLAAELERGTGDLAPGPMSLASGLHVLEASDLREDLLHLPQAVLAIYGSRDRVVSPLLHDVLGGQPWQIATRLVQGAGHMPFASHPDETLAMVSAFLASQDAAMSNVGWYPPGRCHEQR